MTTNYDEAGATFEDLALALRANFIDYENFPVSGSMIVEVQNGFGRIELPRGKRGPEGQPGRAAAPFDSVRAIASASNLPANPSESQKRTAYVARDTGMMHAWDDEAGAFGEVGLFRGAPGDRGPVAMILPGNVTATAPGSEPTHSFEDVGNGRYLYHVTIPRGEQGPDGDEGPPGPAAAITKAQDYNEASGTPAVGSVLRYGSLNKWEPAPYYQEVGPFRPDAAAYTEHNEIVGTLAPERTVVTLNVPGQTFPWRPRAFAGCHVAGPVDGDMALEVRIGGPAGALVARGVEYQANDQYVTTVPNFSGSAPETTVVPANTDVTLYMVMRRISGVAPWKQRKANASLEVWCVPVLDGSPAGAFPAGADFDGGEL
ncbi:hypothetical protein SEA_GOIB_27 [Gordonia phage Goib]|nr:hypothetical protein SEA_GOIB_27 [Gordonia phage Goib]